MSKPDDDLAQWDAAYVLGALDAEDRRSYEDYLATNPEKAAELTELTDLPDILDVLSPDEAAALIEPVGVASLAAKRQQRSRRTVLISAVAAAAALAIVGGVVGATVFPRTSEVVQTVAMAPMQPGQREGLTAQLAVTEKGWGTELNWSCEYTKDWARNVASYDIVVTTHDGTQTVVGSWRPAGDEATGLSAATSIPTSQIQTVDIRVSGDDQPLAVKTL
ncbi:anti-sigma factor family protein [Mycolicibacterium pulveris]|uniref:anti-sigma factor family protein n=1 Tax=Mycolicibacterium pulveris TaxID=36813 RepID=UPI003CF67E5C